MRSGIIDYNCVEGGYSTERVCTRDERRSIKKSAKHCKLCREIYTRYLYRTHGSDFHHAGRDNLLHVLARMSLLKGDAIRLSSIELGDPNRASRPRLLPFAVWADKGMLCY